jgi:hypothetical protein
MKRYSNIKPTCVKSFAENFLTKEVASKSISRKAAKNAKSAKILDIVITLYSCMKLSTF